MFWCPPPKKILISLIFSCFYLSLIKIKGGILKILLFWSEFLLWPTLTVFFIIIRKQSQKNIGETFGTTHCDLFYLALFCMMILYHPTIYLCFSFPFFPFSYIRESSMVKSYRAVTPLASAVLNWAFLSLDFKLRHSVLQKELESWITIVTQLISSSLMQWSSYRWWLWALCHRSHNTQGITFSLKAY